MDNYQEYELLKAHPYAIVDATLRDVIPPEWEQRIIAPKFLENDTSRSPLLVDLRSISTEDKADKLQELSMQAYERDETWASLLLASDKTIDQLSGHLAKRLVLQLAGESTPKQFRYFDPGTFLQLPAILGDKGMSWLLSPIDSIVVPWAGELRQYHKPKVSSAGFSLRNKHYEALVGVGVVNRVQLSRELSMPSSQAKWLSQAESIRNYIQRAMQNGLDDLESIVTFCLHAIKHHPRFDEHPRLTDIFTSLGLAKEEDEMDYHFLTLKIEEDDWQAIVDDLIAQEQETQTII